MTEPLRVFEITDGDVSVNLNMLEDGSVKIPLMGGLGQSRMVPHGHDKSQLSLDDILYPETWTLIIGEKDTDQLKVEAEKLTYLLRRAWQYHNQPARWDRPVYIKQRAVGETNPRFAIVRESPEMIFPIPLFKSAFEVAKFITETGISIHRYAWEAGTPGQVPSSPICLRVNNGYDYYDNEDWPYRGLDTKVLFTDLAAEGAPAANTGGLIGMEGVFGKACQLAEATTNEIGNPRAANDLGWWNLAECSRSTAEAYIGSASFLFEDTGGVDWVDLNAPTTVASGGSTWTLSVIYKGANDAGWSYGHVTATIDGAATWVKARINRYDVTDQLRLLIDDSTQVSVAGQAYQLDTDEAVYVGFVNFEQKAYSTPYCDGSLGTGHSWSGTAHASTSSRTITDLEYPDAYGSNPDNLTIGMRVKFASIAGSSNFFYLFHWGDAGGGGNDGRIFITIDTGSYPTAQWWCGVFQDGVAKVGATSTVHIPEDHVWYDLVVVFKGLNGPTAQCEIYVDGEQVGIDSGAINALTLDSHNFNVGAYLSGGFELNGWLDDLFILDEAWSFLKIKEEHKRKTRFAASADDLPASCTNYLPFDGWEVGCPT